MSQDLPAVTILTSAVGLGVYIPALLVERQLHRYGFPADVEVLENYYTADHQQAHVAHRDANHSSFALAQMSHRMTRDVQDCLDHEHIECLLRRWNDERRDRFIVWSGFWLPIIERYRQRATGWQLHVDHCRIDAEISASFKIHPKLEDLGRPIWLWNWAERKLVYEINVTPKPPLPFSSRDQRLVVHGGGWGIGTYREKAIELRGAGYCMDKIVHDANESESNQCDRVFLQDPAWRPWHKAPDGMHEFPPMLELSHSTGITYMRNGDYHPFHDVIRRSQAIVSKPGGCTLIDSLNSATPVVLLEPYGYAEKSNGLIWEYLGFGIPYQKWRESAFDSGVLESLHLNILARFQVGTNYVCEYAKQLSASFGPQEARR